MAKSDLKRWWQPSHASFERLLQWLDAGEDSHGERYLETRDRLVRYFARRHCPVPDDLADETLNRVARRLEESGSIESDAPVHYCYIVARFVLLESVRQRASEAGGSAADELHARLAAPSEETTEDRERTYACLEACLAECPAFDRQLILAYYGPSPGNAAQRKRLAQRLGLTSNSLAIRACRIRTRLEGCVRACRQR